MTTLARAIANSVYTELNRLAGYTWERNTTRYRDRATGRFVSERSIRSRIESYNDDIIASNLDGITDRFIRGSIDLPTWQRQMAREIKDATIVNMLVGRGGKNAVTQSDYGRIGGRLAFEYRQLDIFANEIKVGLLSEAQIRARARSYSRAPRKAYYDGKTAAAQEAGLTEERRILNPAEHCGDCIRYASFGWVVLGSLPEPGVGSVCRSNCKCTKEYR